MIHIGPQYYRAPFPEERFWQDDMQRMKQAGLNTVQFWVLWGWVEARPGTYDFSDYDRLMDLAEEAGLSVVISTIAAIHPYWIHREVPGSEMVDHMGHRVISSNRGECHHGLTPGGCIDHPEVLERMLAFIRTTAERYVERPHLIGWDAWNELRWNVQADGYACYCEHTLAAFRAWLMERYGSLDELNRVWRRRYQQLDEIQPGKVHTRPFTEMTAFQHFLTWRSNEHGRRRLQVLKSVDRERPITVHASTPCPLFGGNPEAYERVMDRGNDWDFADDFDGFGCSNFPLWGKEEVRDDAGFALHMDLIRSAARDKRLWVSELQGGRVGSCQQDYARVPGAVQQRWVWNAIANGVETILFWCWRDEVFGSESSGFGIIGNDGLAEDRETCLRKTGELLKEHEALLEAYQPEAGRVGVLFSPQSYYLYASQDSTAERAVSGLRGLCNALIRMSVPYRILEEEHLDELDTLDVLFLPRMVVIDEPLAERLRAFVEAGGTVVADCESGAWDHTGVYRYPGERWLDQLIGGAEVGRRPQPEQSVQVQLGTSTYALPAGEYTSPWHLPGAEVQAADDHGALVAEKAVGRGRVITWGTFFANGYDQKWNPAFEDYLVDLLARADIHPPVRADVERTDPQQFVLVRHGISGTQRLMFVFLPPGMTSAEIQVTAGLFAGDTVTELLTGQDLSLAGGSEADRSFATGELPWGLGVFTGPAGSA